MWVSGLAGQPPYPRRMARRYFPPRHVPPAGFGDVLRRARLARGMSYGQLAQRIGTSAPYLYRLEQHERAPSQTMAELIVQALGLDGDDAALVRSAGVPGAGRDYPGWMPAFA